MEIWAAIKGREGKYSVSSLGRIRNERTGKVSYGRETGHGYKKVTFWENNTNCGTAYIHRLVADAFLVKPIGCTEVNHKDGNRANNCLDNLEWVTSSGNTDHAVDTGALAPWNHPRKAIIATEIETGEELYFKSISIAERYFGSRHICQVLKGKRRQVKGYTFRYANGGDANVA